MLVPRRFTAACATGLVASAENVVARVPRVRAVAGQQHASVDGHANCTPDALLPVLIPVSCLLSNCDTCSSTLKTKDKDMTYQCKICKQTFLCTAALELLEQHIDNKHAGKAYDECFNWVYVAAPNMATVYRGSRLAHAAFGTEPKKGYPKDQDIEEFESKEDAFEYIKEKVDYINDDEAITYEE